MPKVPKFGSRIQDQLDDPVRQSFQKEQNFSGVKSNISLFHKLQGQAAKEEEKAQKRANNMVAAETKAKLSSLQTRILHDKENGVMSKKGKASFALTEDINEQWQLGIQEISGGLSNEAQRDNMKIQSLGSKSYVDKSSAKHMSIEGLKHEKQVVATSVAAEREAAVMNFTDAERVQESLDTQEQTIRTHNADTGEMSKAEEDDLVLNAKSDTNKAIVYRLLDADDDRAAQAYFKKHEKEFTADDKHKLAKSIDDSSLLGDAQRAADKIVTNNKSQTEQLAAVRKIKDPETRKKTREIVTQRMSDEKRAEAALNSDNYDTAHDIVVNRYDFRGVGPNPARGGPRAVIPAKVREDMSPAQRDKIRKFENKFRSGEGTKTDIPTYQKYMDMYSDSNQHQAFIDTDFNQLTNELPLKDIKNFIGMKNKLRAGDMSEFDGIRSKKQIVNEVMASLGINKKSPSGIKNHEQFGYRFDLAFEQETKVLGREPNRKETRELAIQLGSDFVVNVGEEWYQSDTKVARYKFTSKDITRTDRNDIISLLNSRNVQVTEENIRNIFLKTMDKSRSKNGK